MRRSGRPIIGPGLVYNSPNNGNYVRNEVKPSFTTDLELGLEVTPNISFAIGANNLFDKKPEGVAIDPVTGSDFGRWSDGLRLPADQLALRHQWRILLWAHHAEVVT